MALTSGARVGIYEVVLKLGEGGMGEVYRARDTKLDREVALKVLPALFSGDAERMARFEREAKVLASLNHPNIAQIFGFEANAIAMELVDGPTLDEIIRGPGSQVLGPGSSQAAPAVKGMSLADALPVLRQIAAALEAAHEQGIVHRDLKPANVKVREDGTVKVLDFGLAKALANDADGAASAVSNSPTLTARSTQLGMILGTAAYMAPEQAKGRAVDRRADVWAFGAVFFEMLSGRRLFEGDDVSDVLASVLKSEPDWSALPADVPEAVRRFLKRCLEKDPKRRLRDIGEGMLQLEEALAGGSMSAFASGVARAAAPAPPAPLWRRAMPVVAAVVVTAGAVAGAMQLMTPAPEARSPVQFQYAPPGTLRLFFSINMNDLAISADGRIVAYSVSDQQRAPGTHLRRLDQMDGALLRGAESSVQPFFSPNGEWVGFVDQVNQTILKKVSVLGGPPVPVTTTASQIFGVTWAEGGTIVIGVRSGLLRVPEAGGTPTPLTSLVENEDAHLWPSAVPGTRLVLFVTNGGGAAPLVTGQLAAVDLASGSVTRFKVAGVYPRYSSTGHIIYATSDGSLRAVPFNKQRVELTGDPIPVLEGVGVKQSGAANFDVSRNGHLVHASGGLGVAAQRTLFWVDRTGRETPLAAPGRNYFYARVAPDNKRLSLDVRDEELDIWIWDLTRETLQRLTDKPGSDSYGLWTPDGRVVFASASSTGRSELFVHRPDGVGAMQQITDTAADKLQPFPNAITPDGKQVIFRAAGTGGKNDLFVAALSGDKSHKKLLATEHDELNPALSPDGKFMVFTSDLSGRQEIYVRPFPDVDGGQWPVSTAGGTEPVWHGREIFYLAPDLKFISVSVDTTKGVTLGKPRELFDASKYFFGGAGRNYDIAPDGKRFVMVKDATPTGEFRAIPMTVVLNWAEKLRAPMK